MSKNPFPVRGPVCSMSLMVFLIVCLSYPSVTCRSWPRKDFAKPFKLLCPASRTKVSPAVFNTRQEKVQKYPKEYIDFSHTVAFDAKAREMVRNKEKMTNTTSNTQQSIKKNINDLDHLLSNLSSHSAAPSRTSSKPASREGSPTRRATAGYTSSHMSRTEERRERLLSNASQYRSPSLGRTPSQSRPHSPGPANNSLPQPSQPYPPPMNGNHFHPVQPRTPEPSQHDFMTSTMRSSVSSNNEFRPVHTTPDPLTGRYADGRITPNHGYTRNFHGSPMTPRKITVPESNIPKKADELLSSLGQEVDHREMQRITQVIEIQNPVTQWSILWVVKENDYDLSITSLGGKLESQSKRNDEANFFRQWWLHPIKEHPRTPSLLPNRWVQTGEHELIALMLIHCRRPIH